MWGVFIHALQNVPLHVIRALEKSTDMATADSLEEMTSEIQRAPRVHMHICILTC